MLHENRPCQVSDKSVVWAIFFQIEKAWWICWWTWSKSCHVFPVSFVSGWCMKLIWVVTSRVFTEFIFVQFIFRSVVSDRSLNLKQPTQITNQNCWKKNYQPQGGDFVTSKRWQLLRFGPCFHFLSEAGNQDFKLSFGGTGCLMDPCDEELEIEWTHVRWSMLVVGGRCPEKVCLAGLVAGASGSWMDGWLDGWTVWKYNYDTLSYLVFAVVSNSVLTCKIHWIWIFHKSFIYSWVQSQALQSCP